MAEDPLKKQGMPAPGNTPPSQNPALLRAKSNQLPFRSGRMQAGPAKAVADAAKAKSQPKPYGWGNYMDNRIAQTGQENAQRWANADGFWESAGAAGRNLYESGTDIAVGLGGAAIDSGLGLVRGATDAGRSVVKGAGGGNTSARDAGTNQPAGTGESIDSVAAKSNNLPGSTAPSQTGPGETSRMYGDTEITEYTGANGERAFTNLPPGQRDSFVPGPGSGLIAPDAERIAMYDRAAETYRGMGSRQGGGQGPRVSVVGQSPYEAENGREAMVRRLMSRIEGVDRNSSIGEIRTANAAGQALKMLMGQQTDMAQLDSLDRYRQGALDMQGQELEQNYRQMGMDAATAQAQAAADRDAARIQAQSDALERNKDIIVAQINNSQPIRKIAGLPVYRTKMPTAGGQGSAEVDIISVGGQLLTVDEFQASLQEEMEQGGGQ